MGLHTFGHAQGNRQYAPIMYAATWSTPEPFQVASKITSHMVLFIYRICFDDLLRLTCSSSANASGRQSPSPFWFVAPHGYQLSVPLSPLRPWRGISRAAIVVEPLARFDPIDVTRFVMVLWVKWRVPCKEFFLRHAEHEL